jgi:hypothetical protein
VCTPADEFACVDDTSVLALAPLAHAHQCHFTPDLLADVQVAKLWAHSQPTWLQMHGSQSHCSEAGHDTFMCITKELQIRAAVPCEL